MATSVRKAKDLDPATLADTTLVIMGDPSTGDYFRTTLGALKNYVGGGTVNTTPAAPVLTADDTADTLSAAHALGASEIVVSINGAAFVAYSGIINVGNVARTAGYYQFKIKAATGRNESAVANSPAFNIASGGGDTTPPAVASRFINSPTAIYITFSEMVAFTNTAGWSLKKNGANLPFSGTQSAGATTNYIVFVVAGLAYGDVVTASYNAGVGTTHDVAGNALASFTDQPVTNNLLSGITAIADWFDHDPTAAIQGGGSITTQLSTQFVAGGAISFPTAGMPQGAWLAIRVPSSEADKTTWYNTVSNSGQIPDSVFHDLLTVGSYDYYITRVAIALDHTQPLILS